MSNVKSIAEISVIADTKQARAELEKLAAATGKTTDELKKQVEQVKLVDNKWTELGKSMVGLQMNDAFKRISEGAKEATGGVLDLNMAFAGYQAAGPWGAAVGAVGVAAFKAAEQFSLMKGRLGDLVEEAKIAADPGGRIPQLTAALYAQEAAILRQNAAWLALPGILAQVNAGFGMTYKALGQARRDMEEYDAALKKRGWSFAMGLAGDLGRGIQGAQKGGPSYDSAATDLGGIAAGRLGGASQIGAFNYLEAEAGRRQVAADAASAASTSAMLRGGADLGGYGGLQAQLDQFNAITLPQRTAEAYGDFNNAKKQSFLEGTFGKLAEFDGYATAFQTLTGAVGASLSAWIDGSMSAGAAFKKFIGEALKGLAVQMSIEAIKHGAYALGSLAFGDFRGAATHGKAALAFGAGATLAAVAAKELGSGGARGGPSGGSAPNVAGGGGGGPQRTSAVIVYDDAFADSNARDKQARADRMMRRATRNATVEER